VAGVLGEPHHLHMHNYSGGTEIKQKKSKTVFADFIFRVFNLFFNKNATGCLVEKNRVLDHQDFYPSQKNHTHTHQKKTKYCEPHLASLSPPPQLINRDPGNCQQVLSQNQKDYNCLVRDIYKKSCITIIQQKKYIGLPWVCHCSQKKEQKKNSSQNSIFEEWKKNLPSWCEETGMFGR